MGRTPNEIFRKCSAQWQILFMCLYWWSLVEVNKQRVLQASCFSERREVVGLVSPLRTSTKGLWQFVYSSFFKRYTTEQIIQIIGMLKQVHSWWYRFHSNIFPRAIAPSPSDQTPLQVSWVSLHNLLVTHILLLTTSHVWTSYPGGPSYPLLWLSSS